MTEKEAKKIIENEKLTCVNWFNEKERYINEVVITKEEGKWKTYITDEKASVYESSITYFDNSEEAFEDVIESARFVQKTYHT